MKHANGDSSPSSACSGSPSSHQEATDPPPTKRSYFSHLSKLFEEKVKEGLKKASKQPPGGIQLEQYLENVHTYQRFSEVSLVLCFHLVIIIISYHQKLSPYYFHYL